MFGERRSREYIEASEGLDRELENLREVMKSQGVNVEGMSLEDAAEEVWLLANMQRTEPLKKSLETEESPSLLKSLEPLLARYARMDSDLVLKIDNTYDVFFEYDNDMEDFV